MTEQQQVEAQQGDQPKIDQELQKTQQQETVEVQKEDENKVQNENNEQEFHWRGGRYYGHWDLPPFDHCHKGGLGHRGKPCCGCPREGLFSEEFNEISEEHCGRHHGKHYGREMVRPMFGYFIQCPLPEDSDEECSPQHPCSMKKHHKKSKHDHKHRHQSPKGGKRQYEQWGKEGRNQKMRGKGRHHRWSRNEYSDSSSSSSSSSCSSSYEE